MSQYALMSLSIPENGLTLLNVSENASKCLNKLFYARVLNMPHHLRYLTGF